MFQLSSDILSLTSDAVVLVKNGRIAYMNSHSAALLGHNCMGKPVKSVFGPEIAGVQAPSFVACVPLCGAYRTLRVSKSEGLQAIFFSVEHDVPSLLNSRFLSSMRENLMNLSVSAELGRSIAEELHDKTLSACFASVTRSYYRLLRTLGNATIVSGLNDSTLPFHPTKMNISDHCRAMADAINSFFHHLDMVHVSTSGTFHVAADHSLIDQLFINLISNSLVHGACNKISMGITESPESIIISLSDDGRGIPPDKLSDVFESFLHDSSLSDMYKGQGLGLAVVRAIAEKHGGTLLLESREGYGTAVRISISKKINAVSSGLSSSFAVGSENFKTVLIGLADCLPDDFYNNSYMD